MKQRDLEQMNLDELYALQKSLAKAIEDSKVRMRQEALAAAEEAARKAGYSLAELVESPKGSKKQKNAPKYWHPEDPTLTWSGRGRQPAWFKKQLEAGTPKESLRIVQ